MVEGYEHFNEKCWIIYGYPMYGVLIYESEGSPGSVDFDWKKVFKNAKKIIGFNHTHPGGFPSPSNLDDITMIGWVKALSKPLLCGIESDGKRKMYLYERELNGKVGYREVGFSRIGRFIRVKDL